MECVAASSVPPHIKKNVGVGGGGGLPSHADVWSRKKALSGDGFPSEYSVAVSLFCHEQIDGSVLQATQDF